MIFLSFLYNKLIEPRSQNEDSARREFILNIFLIASTVLLSFAVFLALKSSIVNGKNYQGDSPVYVFSIWLFFVLLLLLSRRGFFRIVSYIFVGVYFLAVSYGLYRLGVDQPETLLGLALVIVISGVLVGSKFAFLTTILSSAVLITLGYLQIDGVYTVHSYWKDLPAKKTDAIIFSITLAIIAIASWLSNREIEKSLRRARKSETELKKERDSLEITVQRRTKELKEAQAEKMSQLYRFAEFGRLSSGMFHDLINPLNAVSLNMEKIKSREASSYVDKAISAAQKLEEMVGAVRKQLNREENRSLFSLNKEIEYVIDVLSHKAKKAHVIINFSSEHEIQIFGDAIKFNQVVLNLIANAIDSYPPATGKGGERTVSVTMRQNQNNITLEVKDRGAGIPEANLNKIFEPFFTTKPEGQGIGLGLSMTKRIIEKDFGGDISVQSKIGSGAVFTIKIPLKNEAAASPSEGQQRAQ